MTARRTARARAASPLTAKQRTVLAVVVNYYAATGEPCTVLYLARRLQLHRNTITAHLRALSVKGALPPVATPRANLS